MKFADLGLLPEILRAVEDAGYTEPTPIQAQAIPVILAGRDVMGGAQTGTGKTAGFTLPMLHRIARHANTSSSPARHPVRCLILTPTRELAMQVHESVVTYGKHLPLRSVCVYGGVDIKPQTAELREGREIVVATPGRLLDHVQQKSVHFSQVEFVILDEADRMLDMGFIPDIRRILAMLPKERQSLLFSATFSDEIKKLALVFVGTKFGTARLATWLERQGVNAVAIHGDKSQQQRTEALEAFKAGTARVMVATDVAARGLDIDDLPHVINYELPHVAEDYVHRIGRTGRAGKLGDATSLVAPEEKPRLNDIERLIKFKIEQVSLPEFSTSAAVESDRRGRSGGHGHSHRERERHGPKAPVQLPPTASHLPRVAADGFDFHKPYEPKVSPGETPAKAAETTPPKRPLRPVAALLGGIGKK